MIMSEPLHHLGFGIIQTQFMVGTGSNPISNSLILIRLWKVFAPIVSFRFLGISTCLEFLNGLTFFSARSTSEPSPHVRRLLSVTFCKRFWKDKIKGLLFLCCWSPMRQIQGFQDLDLVILRKDFFFIPLLQSKESPRSWSYHINDWFRKNRSKYSS